MVAFMNAKYERLSLYNMSCFTYFVVKYGLIKLKYRYVDSSNLLKNS